MDIICLTVITPLLLLLNFMLGTSIVIERPVVNLSSGPVRGWRMASKATQGEFLEVFKGIPYATPPINELRFKAPLPVRNWTDVMNLSQEDPLPCAQNQHQISGPYSENCLFINVYTPEGLNSSSQLPVMVWIHGGAFFGGSSSSSVFGGDYLVQQGILFVTLNYRVGALGFLNLGTEDVPGNAGLKDQNLALQWVKKEIVNFGGDPEKITIFGQSAGSASVIFHYLSPKSYGLFRSAIGESGSAFAEWSFMATGFDQRAKALSDSLHCTNIDNSVNLTCLQTSNVEDIIKFQDVPLTDNEYIPGNSFVFVPTLEKPSNTAFLSDTPENLTSNLLESSWGRRPLIMGVNLDEGVGQITSDSNYYKQLRSKLQYFIPKIIREKKSQSQIEKDVASIYQEYFRNTPPSLSNLEGYIKIYTDKMFALNIAEFARKVAPLGQTYLYHFDYDGAFKQQHTFAMQMNITKGVNHGDEMGYIFVREDLNQSATPENTTEKKTLRKMVKLWTNFAKYGAPTQNGSEDNDLGNFSWSPVTNTTYHYMQVTKDAFSMNQHSFHEGTIMFWNNINSLNGSLSHKASPLGTLFLLVFVFLFL